MVLYRLFVIGLSLIAKTPRVENVIQRLKGEFCSVFRNIGSVKGEPREGFIAF